MRLEIDISPKEHEIVIGILQKHLKIPAKIWAFGSRVKNKAKRNSDLDLAIECFQKVDVGLLTDLEDAFTDAPLPYKVDIVVLKKVKPEFENIINQHKILLTVVGNIPKLRFPEFRNDGEWEETTLDAVAKITIGEFVIKTKQNPKSKHPVYNAGRSYTGFYDEYNNEAGKIIVSARGANAGFVNLIETRYWAGNSCYSIEIKNKSDIDLVFLYNFVKQNQKKFTDNQQAANIPSVSKDDISKFIIHYPKKTQEQQRIASCLSTLDALITAHNEKLAALKTHKKGLLQNLFPQKGQKMPTYRFPEFRNDGEWVEKPISKLGETINGLNGKRGADFGNGKPYVQYKQVFDKSYIDFSECGKVDIKSDENQNKLQEGDVLFTTSSETPNEVGFASVIVNQPEEDTYLNSFCFIFRPLDLQEVNPSFSRYLFHSPVYRNSVSAIAQGSTRFNISKGAFIKLKVTLPKPQEQQRIASCLSALDALITAQTEKIEALQKHKKGLLQDLFPKIRR